METSGKPCKVEVAVGEGGGGIGVKKLNTYW